MVLIGLNSCFMTVLTNTIQFILRSELEEGDLKVDPPGTH